MSAPGTLDGLAAAMDDGPDHALSDWLAAAPDADRMAALALLCGRGPGRVLPAASLLELAGKAAGLPAWLVAETQKVTGDAAETAALILPLGGADRLGLAARLAWLDRLRSLPPEARDATILEGWRELGPPGRLALNRILSGTFRAGLTLAGLAQALARATGRDPAECAWRLARPWRPGAGFAEAFPQPDPEAVAARPLPFCDPTPCIGRPKAPDRWLAETDWPGLRVQLVWRSRALTLWRPGPEPVTDRFPDLAPAQDFLPEGTVIEGHLVTGDTPDRTAPARLSARRPTRAGLAATPALLVAWDLPECGGEDLRALPLATRRARLERLVGSLPAQVPIRLSPARSLQTPPPGQPGLILKPLDAAHDPAICGWLALAPRPFALRAVLTHVQPGTGELTLALADGGDLVPVARVATGDPALEGLLQWAAHNVTRRFGPVREVPPVRLVELHFDAATANARRKAGLDLHNPRAARNLGEGAPDTLSALKALVPGDKDG